MRSDREKPHDDDFGEEQRADEAKPECPQEQQTVAEAWATGRLKQAEVLLQRFAGEFDDQEPQDPNLLRDYYQWTGNPHYRTDYGWSAGRPEDNDEDPADVIERVNC